jgi:acyl-CoA dehydrogenase
MSQVLSILRHRGDSAFFTAFLKRMVQDQVLVASGTSEKGVGGDIFGSVCTIEDAPDGGSMVTKECPNISYLDHAGAVLVSAMRREPNGHKSQVLIAAEMNRMELQPGPDVGFIGMRGILNRPYRFKATFPNEAIFEEKFPVIARETMTPSIHIFWAALWSGIASSALDRVKVFLAKEVKNDKSLGEIMHFELSRLVDRHHTMNALIRDAIADFDQGRDGIGAAIGISHTARVKRLKVVCSELLEEICQGALGLIGIRGYAQDGPYSLSEPLRDAMSARVMISNYRLLASNAVVERFLDEAP